MKKFICSIIFLLCFVMAWAQSPNLMSYQAIIRNSANQLIVSSPLGVRVSLLQGSASGTVVFREIYNPNPVTNANGLLGLNIGSGVSIIGSFGQVNWSQGPYFVQVEVDPTGGTNYSISSVSQLLSVPYALHAKTAEVPGLPGPQGPAGPQGATGAIGPQGPIGPIGLTGPQGLQGLPGNDGAVGPQGPIGLTGPQGVPGNDGAVGPQGPIGMTGPAGPQGFPGNDGAVGPQGPIGPIGLTGPQGPQGLPGNDGAVGPQGPIGLTGPQGVPGNDGAVGPQGPIGLTGPAGPQGSFPTGTQPGEMNYWNGSSWVVVPPGNYGQLLSFCNGVPTWGGCLPLVSTTIVSAISADGANIGCNVISDGGVAVTARGVAYGITSNPTTSGTITTDGSGVGSYVSTLTGLSSNTQYFVRAYATNAVGTAYGNELTFFTQAPITAITIGFSVDMSQYVGAINNVHMAGNFTDLGATVNGNLIGNWHDFVPMVNTSGNIWTVSVQFPVSAQGSNFQWKFLNGSGWGGPHELFDPTYPCANLDALGWMYNRQVTIQSNSNFLYCYNSCLACGPAFPIVNTIVVSSITTSQATTGGDISSDGGSTVTSRGVAYGLTSNPTTSGTITTDGSGVGTFVSTLSGLTASTTYYVRAYATNGVGTAYGNEIIFSTNTSNGFSSCGGVTDVDGNSYQTVQIGTQCWTQSNLRTSKYRNGDIIQNITDHSLWLQTNSNNTGAWCYYNNNVLNDGIYGKHYNWHAVNDTRGLCPIGWHVSTDNEWSVMVKYLDPNADTSILGWLITNAGGALKSTSGWNAPNTGATNSSGFTAIAGGSRRIQTSAGGFDHAQNSGYWWCSTVAGLGEAKYRDMGHTISTIIRADTDVRRGHSVRCVRD